MLSLLLWAFTSLLCALSVGAQYAAPYLDPATGVTFYRYYNSDLDTSFGYIFPPLNPPSNEFIGLFIGPVNTGWLGNSLGGDMRGNLLIVGWFDGNTARVSPRYTSSIAPPPVYAGPILTVLGGTRLNATHQQIVYRCQQCTTWTGGSINLSNTQAIFGYAVQAAIKPNNPSDPNSSLLQHTLAGRHGISVADAHANDYSVFLQRLLDTRPTGGPGTPTVTPTITPTPTPTGPLSCPNAPRPTYSMVVASGFQAIPVLGRLSTPRGIAIDTAGNLLVVQRQVGLTGHALDANGCVTSTKTIISDSAINHGIDVTATRIFASSADIAWMWDYNPSTMTATNRRTLVTGMNNPWHFTRTLLNSRKYPNLLAVSIGSNSNIDLPTFHPAAGRAIIKVYDINTITSPNGVNSATGGRVFGYGLRNDVGIAEDRAGIMHSIENSLDDAYRTINGQRRDIHTNNPAEKVYRLGDPNNPTGFFGGYPYCFTVWEPSDFTDRSFRVGEYFTQAPNSTLTDAWCQNNSQLPTVVLPPHTAPLDMKFGVGDDSYLYVGMHGSWNRQPPQGYRVVRVAGQYSSTGEWSPTNPITSRTSFTDVLRNVDETRCQSGCFRPVGLVWSANGQNLYVSSDTSGEVFLVKKNGSFPPITTTPTSTPTTIPTSTPTTPTTTTPQQPTPTTPAPGPTQTLWGQCGGRGYTGPTNCASGSVCRAQNEWYSQCVPA